LPPADPRSSNLFWYSSASWLGGVRGQFFNSSAASSLASLHGLEGEVLGICVALGIFSLPPYKRLIFT